MAKANATDAAQIKSQLNELNMLWTRTNKLLERKTSRLEEALKAVSTLYVQIFIKTNIYFV